MNLLFVDTWGWLALWDKKDRSHDKVKNYYDGFRKKNGIAVTTDYVLDETITLIFRRTHFDEAKNYMETINESINSGYVRCESVSPSRFVKALQLRFFKRIRN